VYLEGYNKWIFYFVLRDRWKKLKDRPGISKGLKNAELAHRSWVVSRSRHQEPCAGFRQRYPFEKFAAVSPTIYCMYCTTGGPVLRLLRILGGEWG